MAKAQVRGPETGGPSEDWHPLFSAGLLGIAVLCIIALGGWLRSSEGPPARQAVQRSEPARLTVAAAASEPLELLPEVRPQLGLPNEAASEALVPPRHLASEESLLRRGREDLQRLRDTGREAWTLQVAVACDASNAQRWIDDWEADSPAYLLPASVNGKSCFRLCWGRFASREQAANSPLPARLNSDRPQPRAIAELVR